VRNKHNRDVNIAPNLEQMRLHFGARLRIQCTKRLIHEQNAWLIDERVVESIEVTATWRGAWRRPCGPCRPNNPDSFQAPIAKTCSIHRKPAKAPTTFVRIALSVRAHAQMDKSPDRMEQTRARPIHGTLTPSQDAQGRWTR
jgi:hypothetical protein